MVINHNIAALNTYRMFGTANKGVANSMEKLSSGLRINKAGDDAAGLAISEKMRGQVRGLDMASKNAQDGISLIQTAEGALNETHSILQRMRELAVQSANDTNTATDRNELQKEVDQLSQELSRIGNTTEFNTQKLLNGNFEGTFQIGANENQNLGLSIADMRGFKLGMTEGVTYKATVAGTEKGDGEDDLAAGTYSVSKKDDGTFELLDSNGLAVATSTAEAKVWTAKAGDGDTFTFNDAVTSGTITVVNDGTDYTATATANIKNEGLEAGIYKYNNTTKELLDQSDNVVATSDGTTFTNAAGTTLFAAGDAFAADTEFEVKGINISSQDSANSAITTINDAIETVSAERSKLGAYQNRLDHTINNLGTSSENLTAAESRIRDVDMAKEIMEQTKNSILAQAAQSMLAQANQQPQGVLQLLQ